MVSFTGDFAQQNTMKLKTSFTWAKLYYCICPAHAQFISFTGTTDGRPLSVSVGTVPV